MNKSILYFSTKIILLLLSLIIKSFAYLSFDQTLMINKLIQNKNLTPNMRIKVNKIIYDNYKNKTINDANIFYKENYGLLKNVKKDVLKLYAHTGLLKSIQNFNGKSNFYNYSNIYIKSEMLKCVSDHNFNILPHNLKRSNKISKYFKLKYNIYSLSSINIKEEREYDKLSFNSKKNNKINIISKLSRTNEDEDYNINKLLTINKILHKLDPITKRTFSYRYDYNLKTIRSIEHVSELMCWSNEKTRLVLLDAIKQIKANIYTIV